MTTTPPDVRKVSVSSNAKEVMNSFDLQAIVEELRSTIMGARIENIYQFSPFALLISLHPTKNLVLEAGRRVHLTNYSVERPNTPSLFCSILRRNLRQGRVEGVNVEDFERVVRFKISSNETSFSLVVEVFGGGNILLLDEKDIIIQALTYRRMRDRNVIRGEIYKLPPPKGISPDHVTYAQLSSIKTQKGVVARVLGRVLSIGSPYVEEILLKAGIEKSLLASVLSGDDIQSIYLAISSLIEDSKGHRPRIIISESGGWLDVVPFPILQYVSMKSVEFETHNEAADVYFTRLSTELKTEEKTNGRNIQVEEQKRILKQQAARLEELEVDASTNQKSGDLLYTHFLEVQTLLDNLRQSKFESEKQPIIVSFDPSTRNVKVRLEDQDMDLDLRRSVYENARSFYEQAKTARQKMEGLKQAIEKAEKKIKTQETKMFQSYEQFPRRIRERAWYEKFHWTKSKRGLLLIGGRDATSNELLIKKHMESGDLVFHADTPGAPFVLLKAPNGEVDEEDITQAAQMAASYSSAWKAKVASTDTYWVKPDQISKESPTGEYLTRGAFMIRGQKNYVRNVQLQVSIGLIEDSEGLQVIGGPSDSVKVQTKLVVDIVPGRPNSGSVAKEIRTRLVSKRLELKGLILAIPLDELQRFIPPGGGEIIRD
ncbi:NFACT family protein [Candidatus Bathyarchaeota archaeon]|nr:NFACT family protein [Candidatus Bathyarchaeota archaeon]